MRTVLVTAAAYSGAELTADFGRIPPAFLPVGNRRLYAHQHATLADRFDRILLSLPADFALEVHDRDRLAEMGVEVVRVPVDLDLPSSILHVIAECDVDAGSVAILHGDTLIFGIDYSASDCVSVAEADDLYAWAGCDVADGHITDVFPVTASSIGTVPVLSGFFCFADINLLVFSLAASRGDFLGALRRYTAKRPLRALGSNRWLDFGHVHTYYASRAQITTQRVFNSLSIGGRTVHKWSKKAGRIEAEASWYEQVPSDLRIYLPAYLGRTREGGQDGYRLEFLYLASLADLFVFGRLPEAAWSRILASCMGFLATAARHAAPAGAADDAMQLYLPKTQARLEEFAAANGVDLDTGWTINGVATPSLRAIAERSAAWITPPEPRHLTVVHGDPCFSNILYDFRSQSVRIIDPRGEDAAGSATIWGDNRYDLAKLHHSVVGAYDLIVGGLCTIGGSGPYDLTLAIPAGESFAAVASAYEHVVAVEHGADRAAVEAICLHLFLSMLPLHADHPERQRALLANALRLWVEIGRGREVQ